MLTIKHTLVCDQQGCGNSRTQEYQNLPIQGQIPLPQLPPGWWATPQFGMVCEKHVVMVQNKEAQYAVS